MIANKVKKFWEEYKAPICVVGGICIAIGGYKYIKHIKKLNALDHALKNGSARLMTKVLDPTFPDDMSISEIKAALDKIEGARYSDALAASYNGENKIFIRSK